MTTDHSEGGIGFLRCRGCATLGYYGSDTAAMSHSTVGKGRRRGGVTITEADITSSRYNSWETVGMVTDEIRRRNKTQSEEEKLSTTGTKSDMIRTLLIDDEKGGGYGGDSGKPSARGRQMRTDRGAGSRGSARNKTTNDSNKENVGLSSRTTRSRSNNSASNTNVAATKVKPAAAGTKKTGASGDARAGDVISVAADGTEKTAEVLDIDPRTGMASLWYVETEKAETGVKLSGIKYAIKERYVEPVPPNEDLLDFSDVAPDAPKYEPDDPQMLLQLMSGSLTLEGVSYDENLLS